jgi:hypothetical protein
MSEAKQGHEFENNSFLRKEKIKISSLSLRKTRHWFPTCE